VKWNRMLATAIMYSQAENMVNAAKDKCQVHITETLSAIKQNLETCYLIYKISKFLQILIHNSVISI